jgi:hypothetical protein
VAISPTVRQVFSGSSLHLPVQQDNIEVFLVKCVTFNEKISFVSLYLSSTLRLIFCRIPLAPDL